MVTGHVMTRSRDLSSSSFYSPSRVSANPCLYIGTMRLQLFAAALWTAFTVARIPSRHSHCAASGILGAGITGKTPFNTQ
jgi:phosphate/sulfate permease